jgi:predicted CXXCH cytochrome family protein
MCREAYRRVSEKKKMRLHFGKIVATLLIASDPCYSTAQPVCANCHPKETEAYLSSFMGRSFGSPEKAPPGKVSDSQSGSLIRTEWRNGRMFQSLSEDGLSAEYEIPYRIGAGKVGYSYAAQVGDFLLESPASYFKKFGWDTSPGFAGTEILDFNRVLTNRCLFCHTNARGLPPGRSLEKQQLTAIGCERCHGDPSEHLRRPSAGSIVNPAKLSNRARDSVCEQCHLEGVARILNPGKTLFDFRPGADLEPILTIYVQKQTGPDVKAVSQMEQFASSQCSRQSGGRLWCGTCHDPHGATGNRAGTIKAVCASCHATLSPASHSHVSECTSCHMPQRPPSDVAHAALTDHRILAKPGASPRSPLGPPQEIRAWRDPQADLQQRDLGLAYFETAANTGSRQLAEVAANILNGLAAPQQNEDATVMAALGDLNLSHGRAADAAASFQRACELDPSSGRFAMLFGISLRQGADQAAAVRELRRAIELDPSLERSYLELSALYAKAGDLMAAKAVLGEYLKWNPQSVMVRLALNTLTTATPRSPVKGQLRN